MPKTALSRIIPLYPANSIQLVPLSFSLSNMGVLNENGGIAMGKGAPILRILSLILNQLHVHVLPISFVTIGANRIV